MSEASPANNEQTRSRSPRSWALTGLKVVVTVGLTGWLLRQVGFAAISGRMAQTSPALVVLAAAMVVLSVVLNGLSFAAAVRAFSVPVPRVVHRTALAWTWGMVTPGRLGEFSIVAYLRASGVPTAHAVAVTVTTRLITLSLLVTLTTPALVRLGVAAEQRIWGWLLVAVLLCGLVLINRPQWWLAPARRLKLGPLSRWLARPELDGLQLPLGVVARIGALQVLRLALLFGVSWLLFIAVGSAVSYLDVVTVNSAARFAALMPVSVAGIGVREGVQTALFARLVALDAAPVLAVAAWILLLNYGLAGSFYLLHTLRRA